MAFQLSSQNLFEYLNKQNICSQEQLDFGKLEMKSAKNFNLLLSLPKGRKLLIKQERFNREGRTTDKFLNEWQIHEFFRKFSELNQFYSSLSEVIHFDADNSIFVFNYLDDYRDLSDFYTKKNVFPDGIAVIIGKLLATIHQVTFNRQDCRSFLVQDGKAIPLRKMKSLDRIEPEIFGSVPRDVLSFLALYQRYDSLGKAISELLETYEPCCLTHNDLKLNNILLHNDWEQAISKVEQWEGSLIRLIDWERGAWGDPAFDLGMLIASYLQVWLNSLVVSKSIDIEESLRLAMTPLEVLQPSIAILTKTYLSNFLEIIEHRPDFLTRVVQFTGLALIQQIQAMLQYQKSFGRTGICMLQVAKSLLCRPEQSILTVFGVTESELLASAVPSLM